MRFVLDTNAAVYLLGGRLAAPLPHGQYGISVISEFELLVFPSLAPSEENSIRSFIASVHRLPLSDAVRDRTIEIRRATGLKLPDAIICATAAQWDAVLLTNDLQMSRVAGLRTQSLALK
ncbi:MAG: type II toxin-antitoxin system VapC family toxin [Burkholderiales bacterium]